MTRQYASRWKRSSLGRRRSARPSRLPASAWSGSSVSWEGPITDLSPALCTRVPGAARVAHRAHNDALCAEQLSQMRQQYTLTRNRALMGRGQRVQESFSESRSSAAPRDKDRDRFVTKVTTRRETNL